MKSWDKYSSSGSLQSGDELKEASISEASLPSSPNVAANLLEDSGRECKKMIFNNVLFG